MPSPSHPRLRPLLLALLASSLLVKAPPLCAAPEAAVDAGWILSKLQRPTPSSTTFVELHDSPLLKAPLRLSGEYRRPDADTLVREVRTPYAETTTIHAGEVTIERAGKGPRTFSLARVPELSGLQASFGALLSGDRQLLEQHYRVASDGARTHWTLTLVPEDAALARKVRQIVLHGRGAELRCIETQPVQGPVQRTLLAGAARDAAGIADSGALARLCQNPS
ncbi:MAG: fatty acyl CoA synthetase [Lysobacter sp.]|nr:fatty acyl CoA synthetase [Lysobacter sp.]